MIRRPEPSARGRGRWWRRTRRSARRRAALRRYPARRPRVPRRGGSCRCRSGRRAGRLDDRDERSGTIGVSVAVSDKTYPNDWACGMKSGPSWANRSSGPTLVPRRSSTQPWGFCPASPRSPRAIAAGIGGQVGELQQDDCLSARPGDQRRGEGWRLDGGASEGGRARAASPGRWKANCIVVPIAPRSNSATVAASRSATSAAHRPRARGLPGADPASPPGSRHRPRRPDAAVPGAQRHADPPVAIVDGRAIARLAELGRVEEEGLALVGAIDGGADRGVRQRRLVDVGAHQFRQRAVGRAEGGRIVATVAVEGQGCPVDQQAAARYGAHCAVVGRLVEIGACRAIEAIVEQQPGRLVHQQRRLDRGRTGCGVAAVGRTVPVARGTTTCRESSDSPASPGASGSPPRHRRRGRPGATGGQHQEQAERQDERPRGDRSCFMPLQRAGGWGSYEECGVVTATNWYTYPSTLATSTRRSRWSANQSQYLSPANTWRWNAGGDPVANTTMANLWRW